MRATIECSGCEVVVLLEPLRTVLACPPLRSETDDEARPPLAVDRVGQVADVEQDDGRVGEVTSALNQTTGLAVAAREPEGDRKEESDEDSEGNEPEI